VKLFIILCSPYFIFFNSFSCDKYYDRYEDEYLYLYLYFHYRIQLEKKNDKLINNLKIKRQKYQPHSSIDTKIIQQSI